LKQETISNLFASTIKRATQEINHPLCVSVFEDNAGIIKFDKATLL
jgi:phosphoribosylformylglycinamidine synthase